MGRQAITCGVSACPGCGKPAEAFSLEPIAAPFMALFDWQLGRGGPGGKNGTVFSKKDAHLEVRARASCCGHEFDSLAPVLIADGVGHFGAATSDHVERQLARRTE